MDILSRLQRSQFRSSFCLSGSEKAYIQRKGMPEIAAHAQKFIAERLKIRPVNDGRQTPWKGHPVFIAQHATALCCRGCMEKWHGISREMELEEEHVHYCRDIIMRWLEQQLSISTAPEPAAPMSKTTFHRRGA